MRKFEIVSEKEFLKTNTIEEYKRIILPKRATKSSAGYDFYLPYKVCINPYESVIIRTGIKVMMNQNEVLMIVIRSSIGVKKGLQLSNQLGIIDCDYYNNCDNEGQILISFKNTTDKIVILDEGERIAQGVFVNYLIVDDEEENNTIRLGGFGSTNY